MTNHLPTPEGAQILPVADAVAAVAAGLHTEAEKRDPRLDAALIELLESGALVAARLPDGRLAFTRPT